MRTTVLIAAWLGLVVPLPLLAQQSCQEIDAVLLQCSNGEGITGEPPSCFCDGNAVEPLELTCAVNFACPDSGLVGSGTWPECFCRVAEETTPGGRGDEGPDGPSPGVDLGGTETCEQFFECPSGAEMEVIGGQCACTLVMLPAVEE